MAQPEFERRVRDQHSQFFLTQLAEQAVALDTRDARQAVERIQPDWENTTAAWRYAIAQQAIERLQLALDGLIGYCALRSSAEETLALLASAVARLDSAGVDNADQQSAQRQTLLCHLLTEQAIFTNWYQPTGQAVALSERAMALAQPLQAYGLMVAIGLCKVMLPRCVAILQVVWRWLRKDWNWLWHMVLNLIRSDVSRSLATCLSNWETMPDPARCTDAFRRYTSGRGGWRVGA